MIDKVPKIDLEHEIGYIIVKKVTKNTKTSLYSLTLPYLSQKNWKKPTKTLLYSFT